MKIDEIDAYVTVIRCQSLQQVALSLGLTQPAITRRLQNFEEALGVELLDRNTRPLKATATGRVVYEQCRVIQRELDVLREIVATDTPPVGTLRLGVAQTIADIALTDAMRGLKVAYPDLQARSPAFAPAASTDSPASRDFASPASADSPALPDFISLT
jgi:DNA-binding transcriptional LysR family regulator